MAIVWGSGQDWNAPGGNTSSLNQNQNTQSTQSANKKKKKKKSQSQTGTWGDMAAANAAANLAGIVANKPNLQNQAGIPTINPAVTGTVFKDYKKGDKLNAAQQVFADFYGSSTPNAYQQALNDFITASPLNMQVYKDSGLKGAGLNAFMTTAPQQIFQNTMLGNVLSNLASTPGKVREGLASLSERDDVIGMLASIPGNVAAQFTPSQAENVKNIAKERDSISNTLQEGPMDPNAYGGLGGDRFTEEDIFQSTFPNVETVYTPETPLDNYKKQQEINERDYPLLKKLKDRENIAKEVEEATEQVVPGQFNLNYVRPDAPAINLSGVNDEEIQDLFIDRNQNRENIDDETYNKMVGAYYGVPGFEDDLGTTESSGAPQDTGYVSPFETVVPGGFPFNPNTGSASIPTKFYSDQIAVPEGLPFGANTTNFDYKDGGYLNKFDDGGYANMSTYQKLKMMADSLG